MRLVYLVALGCFLTAPAGAGDWSGIVTLRTVYNDFHIYYDNRPSNDRGDAGLQATFQEVALAGIYSFGDHAITVQVAESSDPDFDNFWGGSGSWDADGVACTPITCPHTAERSELNVTYSRRLQNGFTAFGGFYSGALSWEETAGRKWRLGAGINLDDIDNICDVGNASVQTTVEFENQNFGVFLGGAYSRQLADNITGTVRMALILDGEADVSEKFTCADGVTPEINPTGMLFEGSASSLGLSLLYGLSDNASLNLGIESKSFSYDNGTDYWSGGTARTDEYIDILSLSYVMTF